MHKKLSRKAATTVLAIILILISILPGCNSQNQPTVTLRIWQTETDKSALAKFQNAVDAFKKENPGVEVELESVAWSALSTKLAVAIQSHNEPDLTHLEPFMVATLHRRGLLLPIDDVIGEIQRDSGDIYGAVLMSGHI